MNTAGSCPNHNALRPAESRRPPAAGRPRRLFVVAALAAVAALGITLSFGYADHAPTPHGVRVEVFASPAATSAVTADLRRAKPGGFDVISVDSAKAAVHGVRSQSTAGALIVPPSGPNTIVTATAEGTMQQAVLVDALSSASAAMHRKTAALDVAPLPAGDTLGLSSFVFGIGLLIPSVLGSVGLFLLGRRSRIWWRVSAAVLFALLAACAGVLAIDTVLGALTGAGGELIGVGFLGSLTYVLLVAALQAVVGLPGTGLAAIGVVFVGNAVSGGSVPVAFLPNVFRQIAPWVPNNAIIRATRDVIYFNGHDLGHPLLVLGLWSTVALAVLVAVDFLHLHERDRMPELEQQIYATPGLIHVKNQLQRRGRPAPVSTEA